MTSAGLEMSRKMCGKEAGHVLLHAPDQRQPFTCRGVIEVEAESCLLYTS